MKRGSFEKRKKRMLQENNDFVYISNFPTDESLNQSGSLKEKRRCLEYLGDVLTV